MKRTELEPAVQAGLITAAQADGLAAFYAGRGEPAPAPPPRAESASGRFTFVHVLYYLGGMIAIGAMTLFMTLGWTAGGPWMGFFISVCYGALFLGLTHWCMGKELRVPAGIMATLAVVMVPLAIFCAQMALGYWEASKPYRDYHVFIDWRWILMEFGTLGIGAVLLWRYRFPFMLMPIAVTLWYMSMDLVPYLFGVLQFDWEIRKSVSLWFGLAMTLLAFWVDVRSRASEDYAFWLYIFGVLTFWGGLSLMRSGSELGKLAYCGINVVMILVGAVLGRRVFAVFGGLGLAGYLGYLSSRVFKDSLLFPIALTAIGLGIIALGVVWQRREKEWSRHLRALLPAPIRELIDARAAR